MIKEKIEAILRTLNEAGIRYLVAGGVAVIAYGYNRLTSDIDLVLAMEDVNLLKAVEIFEGMGYRPRVPVPLKDLADAGKRRQWIEEKNALALSLIGARTDDVVVDIMLQPPFAFEDEWNRSERRGLSGTLEVPLISMDSLIRMKIDSPRPKDQDDVLQLRRLRLLREESSS